MTFWERYQEDPDETMVYTVGDGIERMLQSRVVFQAYEGQITGYLL